MGTMGSLVAAGRTSDVYEFGRGAVVKVPRPEVPDHWAAIEADLTRAVRALDVPAPSVLDVTVVDGRDAIVFERIDGRSMWEHMVDDPASVGPLARELAALHRRILAAGPPDGVDGNVDRMQRKLAEAEQLSDRERDEAVESVTTLPRGAALLHGDLHPGNVLMTVDGPVAIDWFDASVGHPAADVIRSSILMRCFDADEERPHLPGARPEMLSLLHRRYVEEMAGELERVRPVLGAWEALIAAARLSEGSEVDGTSLLRLWRDRAGTGRSQLFEVITPAS